MNQATRRAFLTLTAGLGLAGVAGKEFDKFPNVARHVQDAIDLGYPSTLTYHRNPAFSMANRILACGMVSRSRPNSCDEYPFASTFEGGFIVHTRVLPEVENVVKGRDYWDWLRANQVRAGEQFRVQTTLLPGYGGGIP